MKTMMRKRVKKTKREVSLSKKMIAQNNQMKLKAMQKMERRAKQKSRKIIREMRVKANSQVKRTRSMVSL